MELITKDIKGKNRSLTLDEVIDTDNLNQAFIEASKGKQDNFGFREFCQNYFGYIERIKLELSNRTYRHAEPKIENLLCPCGKVRRLSKLPFYDHVIHHAVMQVIYPVMHKSYYQDSYASIKGRGIHYAAERVRRFIDENKRRPLYSVQLDIVKFYGTVNQQICYDKLCKMYHNDGIRWILRDILTVEENGLGIGLYPIQPICNFFLNDLDRFICKEYGSRLRLFRYCDNIELIGFDKEILWSAVDGIKDYLENECGQLIHEGYSLNPITNEIPVDFVGYRFYLDYTLIRKRMKLKFQRKYRRVKNEEHRKGMIASYMGWLMHCNGKNLFKTVTGLNAYEEFSLRNRGVDFYAKEVSCRSVLGKDILIKDIFYDKRQGKPCYILIECSGEELLIETWSNNIRNQLVCIKDTNTLPFDTAIIGDYQSLYKLKYKLAI